MVPGVARRRDGGQDSGVGLHPLPGPQRAAEGMPGPQHLGVGDAIREGVDCAGVVGMPVGQEDQDPFGPVHRTRHGPDVLGQVRAGIDHGHLTATDDPGPGPVEGEGTRVVRE